MIVAPALMSIDGLHERAHGSVVASLGLHGVRWHQRRGFTLLEVILAIGMVAGIALMIAILWRTLGDWQADTSDQQDRMRLQRVVELMREQWADRRATAALTRAGDEYQLTDTTLAFVTATPILFRDWPLVAVSYTIDRASDSGGDRYALIYAERRITELGAPPPPIDRDEQGRLLVRRLVMIDGSRELAWQRFGRTEERQERRAQDRAAADRSAVDEAAGRDERSKSSERPAGEPTPRARGRAAGAAPDRLSPLHELDLHRPDRRTDLDDPGVDRWRPVEPDFSGRLPAVRLVGFVPAVLPPARTLRPDERFSERWLADISLGQEQEVFACVLIVAGSP